MIWAKCYDRRVVRELALSYGVKPHFMEPRETSHEFVQQAVCSLKREGVVKDKSLLVVIAGNFGRSTGVSYVEIGTVSNLTDR
jgi:pyruvate kinase